MATNATSKTRNSHAQPPDFFNTLAQKIKSWGQALGFQQIGITDTDLSKAEAELNEWLSKNFHGTMDYMARHGTKRSRPEELLPGTTRIISARMDYSQANLNLLKRLKESQKAAISQYALGRDYHKVLKKRLNQLAAKINEAMPNTPYRAFVDSAPVLEKPIAEKAGLGWIGKNTNLINRHAGSWFFLGEIYTNLPLPINNPVSSHCGSCQACIDVCPTGAIVAPYQLDAKKCISYLTIEHKGSIPVAYRKAIGNRVYGCDDCQLICPWNRYAKPTDEKDFMPRHQLDDAELVELFSWSESEFLQKTAGSAIRRIGHAKWLSNIAIGLGNAPSTPNAINALLARQNHPSALVKEHVSWALKEHQVEAKVP